MAALTKKPPLKFVRNPQFEDVFNAFDIPFRRVAEMEIAELRRPEEGQVRIKAPVPARVRLYVEKIKGGSQSPPIAVREKADGEKDILDGSHRTAAEVQAGNTKINAYILTDIDDATSRWLGGVLNGLAGLPLTNDDAKRAAEAALELGYSPATIAKAIGVGSGTISRIKRIRQFNAKAAELNLDVSGIPDTLRDRLVSIGEDKVFAAAIALQIDAQLQTYDWTNPDPHEGLLKRLHDARSEGDRMLILAGARADRADVIAEIKTGKVHRAAPIVEIKATIAKIEKTRKVYPQRSDWMLQGSGAEDWTDRLTSIRKFLDDVLEQYQLPENFAAKIAEGESTDSE